MDGRTMFCSNPGTITRITPCPRRSPTLSPGSQTPILTTKPAWASAPRARGRSAFPGRYLSPRDGAPDGSTVARQVASQEP